jgi:hypothetical protein
VVLRGSGSERSDRGSGPGISADKREIVLPPRALMRANFPVQVWGCRWWRGTNCMARAWFPTTPRRV